MYAVGTLNAFVWVISLNYASIAMYDVTVRDAASAIQEEKAYTWAKKLLFFFSMSAWHGRTALKAIIKCAQN